MAILNADKNQLYIAKTVGIEITCPTSACIVSAVPKLVIKYGKAGGNPKKIKQIISLLYNLYVNHSKSPITPTWNDACKNADRSTTNTIILQSKKDMFPTI